MHAGQNVFETGNVEKLFYKETAPVFRVQKG